MPPSSRALLFALALLLQPPSARAETLAGEAAGTIHPRRGTDGGVLGAGSSRRRDLPSGSPGGNGRNDGLAVARRRALGWRRLGALLARRGSESTSKAPSNTPTKNAPTSQRGSIGAASNAAAEGRRGGACVNCHALFQIQIDVGGRSPAPPSSAAARPWEGFAWFFSLEGLGRNNDGGLVWADRPLDLRCEPTAGPGSGGSMEGAGEGGSGSRDAVGESRREGTTSFACRTVARLLVPYASLANRTGSRALQEVVVLASLVRGSNATRAEGARVVDRRLVHVIVPGSGKVGGDAGGGGVRDPVYSFELHDRVSVGALDASTGGGERAVHDGSSPAEGSVQRVLAACLVGVLGGIVVLVAATKLVEVEEEEGEDELEEAPTSPGVWEQEEASGAARTSARAQLIFSPVSHSPGGQPEAGAPPRSGLDDDEMDRFQTPNEESSRSGLDNDEFDQFQPPLGEEDSRADDGEDPRPDDGDDEGAADEFESNLHDDTMRSNDSGSLGEDSEETDLDVMGVETFEHALARRKEEAEMEGNMFDLCDSDAENGSLGANEEIAKEAGDDEDAVEGFESDVLGDDVRSDDARSTEVGSANEEAAEKEVDVEDEAEEEETEEEEVAEEARSWPTKTPAAHKAPTSPSELLTGLDRVNRDRSPTFPEDKQNPSGAATPYSERKGTGCVRTRLTYANALSRASKGNNGRAVASAASRSRGDEEARAERAGGVSTPLDEEGSGPSESSAECSTEATPVLDNATMQLEMYAPESRVDGEKLLPSSNALSMEERPDVEAQGEGCGDVLTPEAKAQADEQDARSKALQEQIRARMHSQTAEGGVAGASAQVETEDGSPADKVGATVQLETHSPQLLAEEEDQLPHSNTLSMEKPRSEKSEEECDGSAGVIEDASALTPSNVVLDRPACSTQRPVSYTEPTISSKLRSGDVLFPKAPSSGETKRGNECVEANSSAFNDVEDGTIRVQKDAGDETNAQAEEVDTEGAGDCNEGNKVMEMDSVESPPEIDKSADATSFNPIVMAPKKARPRDAEERPSPIESSNPSVSSSAVTERTHNGKPKSPVVDRDGERSHCEDVSSQSSYPVVTTSGKRQRRSAKASCARVSTSPVDKENQMSPARSRGMQGSPEVSFGQEGGCFGGDENGPTSPARLPLSNRSANEGLFLYPNSDCPSPSSTVAATVHDFAVRRERPVPLPSGGEGQSKRFGASPEHFRTSNDDPSRSGSIEYGSQRWSSREREELSRKKQRSKKEKRSIKKKLLATKQKTDKKRPSTSLDHLDYTENPVRSSSPGFD
ncbi:hypothetical protein ACHAXT_003878 [Thalassiosira profunda]